VLLQAERFDPLLDTIPKRTITDHDEVEFGSFPEQDGSKFDEIQGSFLRLEVADLGQNERPGGNPEFFFQCGTVTTFGKILQPDSGTDQAAVFDTGQSQPGTLAAIEIRHEDPVITPAEGDTFGQEKQHPVKRRLGRSKPPAVNGMDDRLDPFPTGGGPPDDTGLGRMGMNDIGLK